MPIEKTCLVCGNIFKAPPSRASAKYCSWSCAHRNMVGEKNPRWKGGLVKRNCAICGVEFLAKPKDIKKGRANCCSVACGRIRGGLVNSKNNISKAIIKKCKVCGKEIRVKKSHSSYEGSYCSKECMAKDYKTRLSGNSNPNYKHGLSKKYNSLRNSISHGNHSLKDIKKILKRQENKCPYCGKNLSFGFHVDHIVPIKLGGSSYVGNIQLLCPYCNRHKSSKTQVQYLNECGRFYRDSIFQSSVSLMNMVRFKEDTDKRLKLFSNIRPGRDDECSALFFLPVARGGFHGLYVEMKAQGGRTSEEQRKWIDESRAEGYRAEVCVGADEAWSVICEYLGIGG